MSIRVIGGALVLVSGVMATGAAWARDGAIDHGAQGADLSSEAGARLVPSVGVSREGDVVTYSVTLQNPSNVEVRDVFLTSQVPDGGSFIEAGPNPPRSGFRAVEAGGPVWLSESVPPRSIGGPFVYRVRLGDTAEAVTAWVHWKLPSDGTNVSSPVRALPGFTAATLGATRMDVRGAKRWVVRDLRSPAQAHENVSGLAPEFRYVLEGIDSVTQDGVTASAGRGGSLLTRGGEFAAVNPTDAPGRIITVSAIPADAPPTLDSRTSTTLFESDDIGIRDGSHVFSLSLVEVRPGSSVPTHYHSGSGAVMILEGTLAYNMLDGTVIYGPGSILVEPEGVLHSANNIGPTVVKILVVRLVPDGSPTTVYTVADPHPWTAR